MTEKADPKKDTVKKTSAQDNKTPKVTDKTLAGHKANQKKPLNKKTTENKTGRKPAANPNWALRLLIILLVLLAGAGGGLYALPLIKDRLPIVAQWIGESNNPEADVLTQTIRSLEDRLATQEENIRTLQTQNQAINQAINQRLADIGEPQVNKIDPALLARLDKLEQGQLDNNSREDDLSQSARIDMLLSRMSQLEASFVPLSRGLSEAQEARQERANLADHDLVQTETLNQIESRLTQVENYAARDNNGALLAFRIGELRKKINHGQAFDRELAAVENMIQQGSMAYNDLISDSLSWLSQYKDGVATDVRLKDQFQGLIPALIRAKGQEQDTPWWQRVYGSAKNLIIIRKTADNEGASLDGIIAKTLDLLNRRDVQNALTMLKKLPDEVRERLALWTRQAEIYLRAQDEMDRIESLTAAYYLSPEDPSEEKLEKNPEENSDGAPEKEEAAL